tara:strand:- start:210 stop:359 length:150 start_codon:yes stop_codon:yes gene_type:complete
MTKIALNGFSPIKKMNNPDTQKAKNKFNSGITPTESHLGIILLSLILTS